MLSPSGPPAAQNSQHQQWWEVWRHRLSPHPGAKCGQPTCTDCRNFIRAAVTWAGKGYLIFRPGEILPLITISSLQLRWLSMKGSVLIPQGLLPLLLVAFQMHSQVAGEVGAARMRLVPHKKTSLPTTETSFLKCIYSPPCKTDGFNYSLTSSLHIWTQKTSI